MAQIDPLVSVCIPTYNRAGKLERAVQALTECSYKNLEIIISDNASCDETQNICNALSASDSRVKYFRHPENQGPTKNFEFARGQAAGKYFLWHGDDDYLDPHYIRTCVDALERDPSLVLVSGLAAYHDADNTLTHYGNVIQSDSNYPLFRVLKYLWLVGDNSIFCGIYHVDRVKGIKVPNCLAGDWVWVADVLLEGRARVISTVHVHREFEDSTSSSKARIVSILNAPRWHGKFPWIAQILNVARHLIFQSNKHRRHSLPVSVAICLMIYGLLSVKGLLSNFRILMARIPLVRKIYRKYFKKSLATQ